jgi:hypothetical protein
MVATRALPYFSVALGSFAVSEGRQQAVLQLMRTLPLQPGGDLLLLGRHVVGC